MMRKNTRRSTKGRSKTNNNSKKKVVRNNSFSDAEYSKSFESEIEGFVNDLLLIGNEEDNAPGKRKKHRRKLNNIKRRTNRRNERKRNAGNIKKILSDRSESSSESSFSDKDYICGLPSRYVSDSDDDSSSGSDTDSRNLFSSGLCGAIPVTPDSGVKESRRQKRPTQRQRRGREPVHRSICDSSSSGSDLSDSDNNACCLSPLCGDATTKQSSRTFKRKVTRKTSKVYSFSSDSEASRPEPLRLTCDALSQIEYCALFNKLKQKAESNSKIVWDCMDKGRDVLNSSITPNRSEFVNSISAINKDAGSATAKLLDSVFALNGDDDVANEIESRPDSDQEKSRCNELNNGETALLDFLLSAARLKYLAAGVQFDESNIDACRDVKFIVVTLSLPVGIVFKDNNAGCFVCHVFRSGNASKLKGIKIEIGDQLTAINDISTYRKTSNEVYSLLPGTSIDRKEVQLTFVRFIGEVTEVNPCYNDPDPPIEQIKSDDEDNNTIDAGIDTEKQSCTVRNNDPEENKLHEDKEEVPLEPKDIIIKVKSIQFKDDTDKLETTESNSCISGIALDKYIVQPTEEIKHDDVSKTDLEKQHRTEHDVQVDNVPDEGDETKTIHSAESSQDSTTLPSSQGTLKSENSEKESIAHVEIVSLPLKTKGMKKRLFSLFKRKNRK